MLARLGPQSSAIPKLRWSLHILVHIEAGLHCPLRPSTTHLVPLPASKQTESTDVCMGGHGESWRILPRHKVRCTSSLGARPIAVIREKATSSQHITSTDAGHAKQDSRPVSIQTQMNRLNEEARAQKLASPFSSHPKVKVAILISSKWSTRTYSNKPSAGYVDLCVISFPFLPI